MERSHHVRRVGQAALATTWMVALGGQSAAEAATSWTYNSPEVTFAVVVVAASTCAVLALAVTARGYRTRLAETALLGSFLLGASVLPLAHGLLTEGVLYGPNTAVTMTMLLAVPVSSVAVIPVLAPNAVWSHALLAHWRMFVPMHVGLVFALASASLLWPSAPPEVIPGSMSSWLIVAAAVAICALVSLRHLGLAVISGRYAPLSVAVGFAMIGSAPLSLVSGQEGGAGFWFAHVLDAGGVFVAGAAIYVVYRRSASMHAVLEPIDAVTPLRALEIGLDPLVHRFVADLETKDRITRDHVVRTARLGVLVATELGLASTDVRTVGVGAILHDVGKLDVPDGILNKPGRLTEDEFELVKRHTEVGYAMVSASPTLEDAGPVVRGHHERVDGRGYPDALAGDDIPFGARIVAACDAYDAMANTRQYREGMGRAKAVSVLHEHSGAQWDEAVVDALVRVLARGEPERDPRVFDEVGRAPDDDLLVCQCCQDALPEQALQS